MIKMRNVVDVSLSAVTCTFNQNSDNLKQAALDLNPLIATERRR